MFWMFTYFRIRGAGATDETCFIAKAACIHTHLQSVKFWIKQHKWVWPKNRNTQKQHNTCFYKALPSIVMCLFCIKSQEYLIWMYKQIQADVLLKSDQHPNLLKKYPLASNCCRSMNFPLYSMMRESGAKSRTAFRIFLFFWTWL